MNRGVNRSVRHIEEEWIILLCTDEFHGFIRVTFGELVLVFWRDFLNDLLVPYQGQRRAPAVAELSVFRPHVI